MHHELTSIALAPSALQAKCSKVCGMSNRLIDLYVGTIKAKVARILRKLGLGQSKGQDLLYHHLNLLQALVDKVRAAAGGGRQWRRSISMQIRLCGMGRPGAQPLRACCAPLPLAGGAGWHGKGRAEWMMGSCVG